MKRIAVLGSTGSIGRNTLEVIRKFPDKFQVVALSAHSNTGLLSAQSREFKPDLILLDILMEDMEGSEVAVQLKNDVNTRDIPVVFLTAVVKKEEVASGSGVIGGHPFIAKPISINELISCIEQNLSKK